MSIVYSYSGRNRQDISNSQVDRLKLKLKLALRPGRSFAFGFTVDSGAWSVEGH